MIDPVFWFALACSICIHVVIATCCNGAEWGSATIAGDTKRITVAMGGAGTPAKQLSATPISRPVAIGESVSGKVESRLPIFEHGIDDPYLPANLLDSLPEAIDDIPDNSALLDRFTQGGTVVLELKVGNQGLVDSVSLESSELPTPVAEVVMTNFLKLRFRIGTVQGVPTRFSLRVEVNIRPLDETGSGAFLSE
ncbi:MAG: hypothetical protein WCK63_09615 [Betaproteobacteria bacterium]